MRTRLALTAVFAAALAWQPPSLHAQGTSADSVHWRATKLDLDSIARDKTAPLYSKRAQLRLRVRDSLRLVAPVTPPPVVIPPAPPVPPAVQTAKVDIRGIVPMTVGQTLQLQAIPRDASNNALTTAVSWSATPATVADVSGTGLVTAKGAGTAQITAKADTASRTLSLTVSGTLPPTQPPVVDTTAPPVVVVPPAPPGGAGFAPHPFSAPSNGAQLAELPRDSVPIAYPTILRVISVVSLQAALDTAKTGDALELAKCSKHPPVTVKLTARAGPVVVRTAGVEDGKYTTKMTEARADSLCLATIETSNSTSPVWVNPQAHDVRFSMVRIATNYGPLNAIFRANNNEATPAELPHHITLDRVVIDGRTFDVRRCVLGDIRAFALLYSTAENCHSAQGDAQAFVSWNSPGPFRIQGNTLHGSHQGTMFGGADSRAPTMMPADAIVEDNTIERPPEWTAQGWGEKTLVEQKAGTRMLYQRNIVRHVHKNGQAGFGFLVKTEHQSCTAPWTQSADVTIRYNLVEDVANGFNFAANIGTCAGINAARTTTYGNVVGPFNLTGDRITAQFLGALDDAVFLHNTFASAGTLASVVFDGAAGNRTVISGNVLPHGAYGVKGNSTVEGSATVTKFMAGGLFRDNVVYPAQCSLYPATTLCALPSTLPLASDGLPIGAP